MTALSASRPQRMELTERDREVLAELEATNRSMAQFGFRWATPLECGGGSRSDHSYRLSKLCRLGLAVRKQRGAGDDMIGKGPRAFGMSRGSWCYRITEAGIALVTAPSPSSAKR